MMAKCLGLGLRAASKRPALVFLLWAVNLGLGILATVPAWAWWRDGFASAPAADAMLNGFNFATYVDLSHYDRTAVSSLLMTNLAALMVVAGVMGALTFGGTLEILRAEDARTFLHRFCRGAGHFFGRFLRLAIYTAVAAVLVTGPVAALLVPALKPLEDSAWEPGWVVALAIRLVVIGVVLLFFLLVLDYARIRVAADDTRRAFRTWLASVGFVLRNAAGAYGITLAFAVLFAVLLAVYFGYCGISPANTRELILLLFIVQQAVMWLRTGLRVAHVAAEREFLERRRPAPAATAAVVAAPPPSGDLPAQLAGSSAAGEAHDRGDAAATSEADGER
jgi:hypothetical protein